MADRRKITIKPDGNIVVIGGYKVAGIARAAGLRPTYSASAGGWMLDLARLPELVTWLEYRNLRYDLDDGSTAHPATEATPTPHVPSPRTEMTLW